MVVVVAWVAGQGDWGGTWGWEGGEVAFTCTILVLLLLVVRVLATATGEVPMLPLIKHLDSNYHFTTIINGNSY